MKVRVVCFLLRMRSTTTPCMPPKNPCVICVQSSRFGIARRGSPRFVSLSRFSSDLFRFAFLVFRNTPICSNLLRFLFRTDQGNPCLPTPFATPQHVFTKSGLELPSKCWGESKGCLIKGCLNSTEIPKVGIPKPGIPKSGIPKTGIPKTGIPKVGKTHTGTLPETEISKARDSEARKSEDRDSESRDSEAGDSENGRIQSPLNADTP